MNNIPEKNINVGGKVFQLYIPYERIEEEIARLALRISQDYAHKPDPLFLGVLNGSFMFLAEMMKNFENPCEISFVKLVSYSGTRSTGAVSELIGLSTDVRGRHIIVVEDIVETGESIESLVRSLIGHEPASIEIATLLFKPGCYKKQIPVKYAGFSIPDDFIIGFGMDYDQKGRNLRDLYKIIDGQ